jgi:hypothetical protein
MLDSFDIDRFKDREKITANAMKTKQYESFLNATYESGQKIDDLLEQSLKGKSDSNPFLEGQASKLLSDYCNTQKQRFAGQNRTSSDPHFGGAKNEEMAIKMLTLGIIHGAIKVEELEEIIKAQRDVDIKQLREKFITSLESMGPDIAEGVALEQKPPAKNFEYLPPEQWYGFTQSFNDIRHNMISDNPNFSKIAEHLQKADFAAEPFKEFVKIIEEEDPSRAHGKLATLLGQISDEKRASLMSHLPQKQQDAILKQYPLEKSQEIKSQIVEHKKQLQAQKRSTIQPEEQKLTELEEMRIKIRSIKQDYAFSKRNAEPSYNEYEEIAKVIMLNEKGELNPNRTIKEIAEVVKEMGPKAIKEILVAIDGINDGNRAISKAVLLGLPDKKFAEVITVKDFKLPFSQEELRATVEIKTGVTITDKKSQSQAFSKLLHSEDKVTKVKMPTFVEKYVTKRSQYKSFAEKVRAEKSGGTGVGIGG